MNAPFVEPLRGYPRLSHREMAERTRCFLAKMRPRRTVRNFSSRPVRRNVTGACIRVAGTATSQKKPLPEIATFLGAAEDGEARGEESGGG